MTSKRSLFNKPAWASKQVPNPDADAPIFVSNAYDGIIEEQKRKQERRAAKVKEREEKQRLSEEATSVSTKAEHGKAVKRRKVSVEPKDGHQSDESTSESAEDNSRSVRSGSRDSKSSSESIKPSTTKCSPRRKKKPRVDVDEGEDRRPPNKTPTAIVIDSDEEVVNINANKNKKEEDDVYVTEIVTKKNNSVTKSQQKATEPESESDADADEYIRELKRQARDKAHRKKQELDQLQSNINPSSQQSAYDILSPRATVLSPPSNITNTDLAFTGTSSSPTSPVAQEQDADPDVQILIKTIIPHAKGLIITRRASQPLDRVREFWTMHNNLDPNIASRVFFTWNGTRLYNSTTMRSVLGQIRRKHGTKKDGGDLSEGKIEIEAVTQEIFDHRQMQKQRERERLMNEDGMTIMSPTPDEQELGGGDLSSSRMNETATAADGVTASSESANAPTTNTSASGIIIRLVADSAELEPMNLRVRPDTTMQRIVRGFRKQRNLENDERNCWLVFDGDRLDDEMTVEEAGFEADNVVEVYVR